MLQWYSFDRTWQGTAQAFACRTVHTAFHAGRLTGRDPCTPAGLFMASLTALAGPVVEILLIQQLHLYHYNHAGPIGVPNWIAWVYFCGSPAVGNLGRKVRAELLSQNKQQGC